MSESAAHPDTAVTDYLAERQCARQWRGFLRALAAEFAEALPAADLRALLRRVGARFAVEAPLPALQTLDELQDAFSRVWLAQDWGWVALAQQADHVAIRHEATPLVAAFGPGSEAWAGGFLEGAYQHWFDRQGAPGLQVRQAGAPDRWGGFAFRLGR
ncbi:cellulose biosynthesis protein BcsD [Xylophilus sp.]|uniref:cellulose biosynthesis protein BcsD n=1 Tax=Xylophilus sp. TaxID=2653893 RepID=UPI0013BB614F|nr:cellulose biosynthesis protein BcsD [Xylophilus sp.]KAF1050051.1 MAG: Cellulose synthase operon protein D [Xylophilus sp.]